MSRKPILHPEYYTTRGLKILDYTRRVARKHHEIVDRDREINK
jgi:hypothetical protein